MNNIKKDILLLFEFYSKGVVGGMLLRQNIDAKLIPTYKSEEIDSALISLLVDEYIVTTDSGRTYFLTEKGLDIIK